MPGKKVITVKSYGLVSFTKKAYVTMQIVVLLILSLLFVATFFIDMDKYIFGNARVAIAVVAFLEVVESYFTLRKFKQKEEQSL